MLFGVVFVAPLPLWAGQPVPAPAPGAPPAPPIGWPAFLLAAIFALGTCLPFRPYAHALHVASQREIPKKLIFGLTALLALTALLIYPRFGSDIFDYLGFERMWLVYGDNPLLAAPGSHPSDWSTPLVWFANQPPAYGPLWAVLTWPLVRTLGDSPEHAVLGYKLLALAGYAACCALLWAIVEPGRRAQALLLFAWSPLVLFETLGKVHNDVLVAAGALAALWLLKRNGGASVVVGVTAALIKLTSLVLVPPLMLRAWRTAGWRGLGAAVVTSIVIVVALYAPFWAGAATFDPLLHQTGRLVWSPGTLLIALADLVPGAPHATVVRLLLALIGVSVGIAILLISPLHTVSHVARTSGSLLLVSVLLMTTAVFAHYLVPAVALAAASADRGLHRTTLWLSVGTLAAYGVEVLGSAFGSDWLGSRPYQVLGSLVLLGPLALAWLPAIAHRLRPS